MRAGMNFARLSERLRIIQQDHAETKKASNIRES